jgi:hypothetical protein
MPMTRWEALVRFDDEIRGAAETLMPFGSDWVDRLGEAFFALKEDRSYLQTIVDRLKKDAEFEAARRWLDQFSQLADGEICTKESLAVLLEAENRGFTLSRERDGSIALSKNSTRSFLRSNADIQRYSKFIRE